MSDDIYPVQRMGPQAVVALPEHIDVSNAGQIREQLLLVIDSGAATLIADMTATVSSDHAGADAVARAHQRAAVSGAQLRLVVTAPIVRRVLSLWVPNTVSPHATWAYSRSRPPGLSRRRTRILVAAGVGSWRPAGGFWCSARCGRCVL